MTLGQIRAVSEAWKIPLAALAKPYPLNGQAAPRRKRKSAISAAA